MKVKDILNKECTVLGSGTGYISLLDDESKYVQTEATLADILDLGKKWKNYIDILRALPYHSEEQLRLKKYFPCWMTCGKFKQSNVKNDGIYEYSNLLAIDIDKIENPNVDMDWLKKEIFNMKSVVLVMESISGCGIYAIFLIEDGKSVSDYCRYMEKLFRTKYNIEIDKKCYNVGRKRFISYDDNMLIKSEDVEIEPWSIKLLEKKKEIKKELSLFDYKPKRVLSEIDEDSDFERKVNLLIKLGYDTGSHWANWASFGRIFKPFENGKELFERISRTMSGYNPKKFDKDWDRIDSGYIISKEHAIAYITTILNNNYSNWKGL